MFLHSSAKAAWSRCRWISLTSSRLRSIAPATSRDRHARHAQTVFARSSGSGCVATTPETLRQARQGSGVTEPARRALESAFRARTASAEEEGAVLLAPATDFPAARRRARQRRMRAAWWKRQSAPRREPPGCAGSGHRRFAQRRCSPLSPSPPSSETRNAVLTVKS
jgi:hypothetical protein